MSLILHDHQSETVKNALELYKKHRSTGVMVPTGGGKSFIAIAYMIIAKNNPNFHGIKEDGTVEFSKDENDVINDAKIYYLAPTNDIFLQVQIHMAINVLGISENDIENMTLKDLEYEVKKAFPNLHFICYQGLDSEDLEKNGENVTLDTALPDLVIADEVHRSGAPTFKASVERLLGFESDSNGIKKNPNALKEKDNIQFLSISATPERDLDGKDMIRYWNELIGDYTDEELKNKEDYAMDLTLVEAKKQGIVNIPSIVNFDANLVDTEEYKYLVEQSTNPRISPSLRKETLETLNRINLQIFGEPNFHLLSQEEQDKLKFEKNVEVIVEAIKDGKLDLKGKYIIFSKPNRNQDGSIHEEDEINGEKSVTGGKALLHLQGQYLVVENLIKEAIKRLDIDNIIFDSNYLSSEAFSLSANKETLLNFNNLKTKDEAENIIHFITATRKLDEGVHISGIKGSFMLKSTAEAGTGVELRGQSIMFSQEFGRNIDTELDSKRVLFDYVCNVFRQNMNKEVPKDQLIEELKLTPIQQMLADGYDNIKNKIPHNGELNAEYTKLVGVLDILSKYYTPLNTGVILGTLEKTLDSDNFRSNKEKIIEDIHAAGLEKLLDKKYKFKEKLKSARNSLYEGKKFFSTFNIDELIRLGIIDIYTLNEHTRFVECFRPNDNGFITAGPLEHLYYQNIATGTLYDKNGKDIEGYTKDQFDPITGKDKEGFYRSGFNDEGIHRVTGTIHDERGFMADGNNILTGEPEDLLGYNRSGYRKAKFYDMYEGKNVILEIEDFVLDRNGLFHRVVDGRVEIVGEKYYTLADEKR